MSGLALGIALLSTALAADQRVEQPLMSVAAIRHLTPEEAAGGLPVKISGVISYNCPARQLMFVQDETGGVYVRPRGLTPPLNEFPAGTLVEVEGITVPGLFAPYVDGPDKNPIRIRAVGQSALPEPLPVTQDQLGDTQNHSLWVEIGGVVRAVRMTGDNDAQATTALMIGPASARFTAMIYGAAARDPSLRDLVGAQVRLRGVYGTYFNERRQMVGMRLLVSSRREIVVDRPGQGSPFSIPTGPISSLMQFSPSAESSARAHVGGVVTLVTSNHGFAMQDETAGLWVTGEDLPPLHPGDRVEVAGFTAQGAWNPVLEDVEVRIVAAGTPPAAAALGIADAFHGARCFECIQLDAELLQVSRDESQPALIMQADGRVFRVQFADPAGVLERAFEDGSVLRLTGICLNEVDPDTTPVPTKLHQSQFNRIARFRMLVDKAGDVNVLSRPSWWSVERLLAIVAILLGVLAAAALWLVLLRRKLVAQTATIRERLARETIYEERTRIARELHDTLEQELTGIAMQIDAASAIMNRSPDAARRSLETARMLLDRSRVESRRSIWELRSTALERGGLVAALEELTSSDQGDGRPLVLLSVEGIPRRLPAKTETHLFRIGHEAISNAVKHGHPRHVWIRLRFDDSEITLTVEDDGTGFDVPQFGGTEPGHFGLLGMQERATKIHARLTLESRRGAGTRIAAAVECHAPQDLLPR